LIKKDEYDMLLEVIKDADGKELGFDVKKVGDKYIRTNYSTITDGKGDKIRKNKNFAVMATGNTNMKEISSNFSGNNRQDYSLVDRFAGSFYEINYDEKTEEMIFRISMDDNEFERYMENFVIMRENKKRKKYE
jgi:hypothetical protein